MIFAKIFFEFDIFCFAIPFRAGHVDFLAGLQTTESDTFSSNWICIVDEV